MPMSITPISIESPFVFVVHHIAKLYLIGTLQIIISNPYRGNQKLSEHIQTVTDSTFKEQALESPIPVLVDFWADWCGPCKAVAPILETIAEEYAGRIQILKLNVDENKERPSEYGIRGIPTLILFKDGTAKATHVGAMTKSQLSTFIDQNI